MSRQVGYHEGGGGGLCVPAGETRSDASAGVRIPPGHYLMAPKNGGEILKCLHYRGESIYTDVLPQSNQAYSTMKVLLSLFQADVILDGLFCPDRQCVV